MVFSSFVFLFRFLPVVLLTYYILPVKLRHFWLMISSIFFYAWGEPKYVILLIFSIIANYSFGILIHRYMEKNKKKAAGIALASAVCANVLLLCVFKYLGMLVHMFESVVSTEIDFQGILMPVGISFYTFQSISYLVDVYRGDAKVQRNIVSFGMYIAMFPQLIAGPVVRYQSIEAQINAGKENDTNHSFSRWIGDMSYGIGRFMIGLSKKVLLANNAGVIWKQVSELEYNELSAVMAWLGIIFFAFQIYFDFSGYSDMAIGLAAMFGFCLEENFNYPYISGSITEFWRRWHISIGTWFREYVYIPLGGNRVGKFRHIINILLVWMLTGIWHGASYNFLLWGLYFAVIILLEKYVLLEVLNRIPKVVRHIYSLVLILFGWVIFEQDSIGKIIRFFAALFGKNGWGFCSNSVIYLIYTNLIFAGILIIGSTPIPARIWMKAKQLLLKRKQGIGFYTIIKNIGYIALFLLSIAYLAEESYNPFLYFRF